MLPWTCFGVRHRSGLCATDGHVTPMEPNCPCNEVQILQPQTHKLMPDPLPPPFPFTPPPPSPFSSPALSFQPWSTEPVGVTVLFFSVVSSSEPSSSLGLPRTTQADTGLPPLSWVFPSHPLVLTLELPVLDYEHIRFCLPPQPAYGAHRAQRQSSPVCVSHVSLAPGLQRCPCVCLDD